MDGGMSHVWVVGLADARSRGLTAGVGLLLVSLPRIAPGVGGGSAMRRCASIWDTALISVWARLRAKGAPAASKAGFWLSSALSRVSGRGYERQ